MNGFISRKAVRFTLVASACLLSGFVSGSNFHGFNLEALFPKTEINFSKITWISSAFEENKVSLAKVEFPSSSMQNQEIKLADFHLPVKRSFVSDQKPKKHHHLRELGEVFARIQTFDLFKDYRVANQKMNEQFILAMKTPAIKPESVVVAASSALEKKESIVIQNSIVPSPTQKMASFPIKKLKRHKTLNRVQVIKIDTQKMSIQEQVPEKTKETSTTQMNPVQVQTTPVVLEAVDSKVQTVQSSAVASNNIQEAVEKSENETLGNKLENQLLEQHIQFIQTQNQKKLPTAQQYVATKPPPSTVTQPEEEIDHQNDVNNIPPDDTHGFLSTMSSCPGLPKLHLIKPAQDETLENTQICPTQKTWISKNWNNEGWLKLETEGYFPLLTYYPQINSDKTLLLDQNSVALLAIKSGVRFEHGMGLILGSLPLGYKIEFSGRSEEVQYFELNSKKYFIILNVEPGAGVTELVSEKNQNENASVFTPVLGDTVTYLDLVAPSVMNIPVKVVKVADKTLEKNNADLTGLTVGISTQTQTQAITQVNGLAVLKNARILPGYPVFVDVSSKFNGERSYQYRYQLNKRTRNGIFILKQYPEKMIYQWLKQIKLGLSDQSGMIFGQFNRKRLDGFRKHYTVKVETISEKFGLLAKNFTVLWDEKLSEQDPLEGDRPRFLSVQVPEGLTQTHLMNEENQIVQTTLIPVSPRVINVVSE